MVLTIFVHIWQVDFITEENKPFVELHRGENYAIGCATELAVVVECLQKKLWCCGTGEVQAYHLKYRNDH